MAHGAALPLDRLPHAPGRLPVLGDVTSVDRKRPTQHELTLSASLGPIFSRKLLGSQLVIVSGARLAAQTSDERNWGRALVGPGATLRQLVPDGMFTARSSDPLWGQARRILTPGFTQSAMRVYHSAMDSVADDLVKEWTSSSSPVDVHSAMTRSTLEVIGRAGFGTDLGLFRNSAPGAADSRRFVDALAGVLEWAGESTNDLPLIGTVRELVRTPGIRRDTERMRGYVDAIIDDRRQDRRLDRDDLLHLMLDTTDPDTGQALPLANVRNQVITFLVAGHETTAALMEVALHHLAADPALQDRLVGEVRARGFDYDAVSGLKQVKYLLNECLRLAPPVPGFFRLARTPQELGGYEVPAGRAVFVLALAAQRDPDVRGPTASAFDPQRFDAAELRNWPDRYFQPWGVGPRSCIGRAFALHESTLLLARILDSFVLSDPGVLTMRERGTLRPDPFTVQVHHRR